jgi:hypothetical protein
LGESAFSGLLVVRCWTESFHDAMRSTMVVFVQIRLMTSVEESLKE